MKIDIAKAFTQPGWAQRAWKDDSMRNGWILEGTITPNKIHIFSNIGNEFECIIKGIYEYDKILTVDKSIIS